MEAYLDWQSKSGGIKLNDVIEEFKYVYKGQEIKAGDFVNYINGVASKKDYGESVDTQLSTETYTGQAISAVALDESRVFIAHKYGSLSHLYGMVVTINGATITAGIDTALDTYEYACLQVSAVLLSENRVFIAYNHSNGYQLYGMVVAIDGATITTETITTLASGKHQGQAISAVALDENRVFIAHSYDNSNRFLYGLTVKIDGTTITKGTDTQLVATTNAGYTVSTCLLPNGNVFIAHSYGDNLFFYGIVVSINDTTITKGTDTAISTSGANAGKYISTVALPNGQVFIAHSHLGYSYLRGIVCSISETTITLGTDTPLTEATESAHSIAAMLIGDNKIFITRASNNTDYYLNGMIVNIEGDTITVDSDTQLSAETKTGYKISPLLLNNGTIFIAHSNSASYYLNAQIFGIDYENNIPTNNIVITEYEQQVTPAIEPPFNAVALSSGVGGTDTEHNEQVKIARPNVGVI